MAWTATSIGDAISAHDPHVVLARIDHGTVSVLRVLRVETLSDGSPRPPEVGLWPAPGGGAFLRIAASSSAYGAVRQRVDAGSGARELPFVFELDTRGAFVRDVCADEGCDVRILASGPAAVVLATEAGGKARVEAMRAGGERTLLWMRDVQGNLSGPASHGCTAATLTADGEVVCAGHVPGPVATTQGVVLGANPSFTRVGLDGTSRWTFAIAGIEASIDGVVTSGDDVVVAGGSFKGEATFGEGALSCFPADGPAGASGYLLRFSANGSPRWARMTGDVRGIAAGPDGIAVARLADELRGIARLVAYSAEGERLWDWTTTEDAGTYGQVAGLAGTDHGIVATTSHRDPSAAAWSGIDDVGVLWFDFADPVRP